MTNVTFSYSIKSYGAITNAQSYAIKECNNFVTYRYTLQKNPQKLNGSWDDFTVHDVRDYTGWLKTKMLVWMIKPMESSKCISILLIVHLIFWTYLLVVSWRGYAVLILDFNTRLLYINVYFAIQTLPLCDNSNAWLLFQLLSPHGHYYCTSSPQQRHKDIIRW